MHGKSRVLYRDKFPHGKTGFQHGTHHSGMETDFQRTEKKNSSVRKTYVFSLIIRDFIKVIDCSEKLDTFIIKSMHMHDSHSLIRWTMNY